MSSIHPTAVIQEGAIIGEGTSIGPYTVIGPQVVIGKNNKVGSHVVIEGITKIGDNNKIFQFASLGAEPQDLKYHGEPSSLTIGDNNIIREYVTLQPGTENGGMKTEIGSNCLFMACSHIGHDCKVGNNVILANSVGIAGHVTIEDWVIIGGLSGVHQFVRLGAHSYIAAGGMVGQDVPPFCTAQGDRAELVGINTVGLKRRGFTEEQIRNIKRVFKFLFLGEGVFKERLTSAKETFSEIPEALTMINFILSSTRGITSIRKGNKNSHTENSGEI